jgi:hypothetical protein
MLLHGNRAMEEIRQNEKRRQNATICVTLIGRWGSLVNVVAKLSVEGLLFF